ncbi:MAG: amidohydrolase family protein [Treponema sp.]|nr:amidohydrolase family protein [Treponema sp.]
MSDSLLIYNARLLDAHTDTKGAVFIENGKIVEVFKTPCTTEAQARALCGERKPDILYNALSRTLQPAFVDMHVHLRYPGQTKKEDLNTGLHAAVAGGVGTLVAMPNTSPVISSIEQVVSVNREAAAYHLAHVYQSASLTGNFSGTDTSHVDKFDKEHVPVITEDGRDVGSAAVMLDVMRKAARKDIVVSCHSEDVALAATAKPYREKALAVMHEYHIPAWGAAVDKKSIPASALTCINDSLSEANRLLALAEDIATLRNLEIADMAGCRIHIAHVSTKKSMEAVLRAQDRRGTNVVTCEVTPHHFCLDGSEPPLLYALVNPPLRSENDRLFLVKQLQQREGVVISTDHAPHTLEDKTMGSPGFTGIELSYALSQTMLIKKHGMDLQRLSQIMSQVPAQILGRPCGLLCKGYDADLVLVAPDEKWTIHSNELCSKGKATPFDGMQVYGRVHATFIGGKEVYTLNM